MRGSRDFFVFALDASTAIPSSLTSDCTAVNRQCAPWPLGVGQSGVDELLSAMDPPLFIAAPEHVRQRQPEGWGTMLHPPLHPSITSIKELELVRRMLASSYER